MDPVTPFDWHRMFIGEQPPLFFLEIVFRVVVIYLFTVLLLRFMGKRGQQQLSPFEFVVVIALGSATGDVMFYPQVPILYACLVVVVVVTLSSLAGQAQLRSQRVNDFLEGRPRLLIEHGRVLDENVRLERLRPDEFLGLLREEGIEQTGEVRYAFLERSGKLGLYRYDEGEARDGEPTFPLHLAGRGTPPPRPQDAA